MRMVFVHGSTTREPAEAWPRQVDMPQAVFATMPGYADSLQLRSSRWQLPVEDRTWLERSS